MFRSSRQLGLFLVLLICLAGCSPAQPPGHKLRVVATTTIVGDVVKEIGGDAIELTVLLPAGADPHGFEPTPQDVARVAQAQIVFMNGAGLEEFIAPLLENAGGKAKLVSVSEGIELLKAAEAHEHADEHEHEGGDPHVWFDPNNVIVWAKNIEQELAAADAANARLYADHAQQYQRRLQELDGWIQAQVAQIPQANRKLVTDHTAFTYFAHRYGFEQIGAVISGYSSAAQPSAQELAQLQDAILKLGVKAVFVGETANPNLSKRLAEDTGIKLVFLYTGSLSEAGGPASTFIEMMQHNTTAMVEALK